MEGVRAGGVQLNREGSETEGEGFERLEPVLEDGVVTSKREIHHENKPQQPKYVQCPQILREWSPAEREQGQERRQRESDVRLEEQPNDVSKPQLVIDFSDQSSDELVGAGDPEEKREKCEGGESESPDDDPHFDVPAEVEEGVVGSEVHLLELIVLRFEVEVSLDVGEEVGEPGRLAIDSKEGFGEGTVDSVDLDRGEGEEDHELEGGEEHPGGLKGVACDQS